MRLPFQSPDSVRERIRHVDGVIKLVAVRDGGVAGYGELVTIRKCRGTAMPARSISSGRIRTSVATRSGAH